MNHYELMVIFSSTLTEDEEKAQLQQVEEIVKHEKASILFVDHWGKRKLAYVIKKQRQGYYEWIYFEGSAAGIAEIDRKLKMSETILRFMILKMEKIQVQNLHKDIERRAARQAQAEIPAPEPVAAANPVEEPEIPEEPVSEVAPETSAQEEGGSHGSDE